jgi:hypothetical protein
MTNVSDKSSKTPPGAGAEPLSPKVQAALDKARGNGQPPATEPPAAPAGDLGFDIEKFRIDSLPDVVGDKEITLVPVRRPKSTEYFRVHPGADYVMDTLLVEHDEQMDKVCYLVKPHIADLVLPELHRVRLFTAITKYGTVFLWPVKLPLDEKRSNDRLRKLAKSALRGAERAKEIWVKVVYNRETGGYEPIPAKRDLGVPQWPDLSYTELVKIAFEDNIIGHAEHDVIRELEGDL